MFRGNRIGPDLGLVCLKLYDDDDTLGYDEIMMFHSGCEESGNRVTVWDCSF